MNAGPNHPLVRGELPSVAAAAAEGSTPARLMSSLLHSLLNPTRHRPSTGLRASSVGVLPPPTFHYLLPHPAAFKA